MGRVLDPSHERVYRNVRLCERSGEDQKYAKTCYAYFLAIVHISRISMPDATQPPSTRSTRVSPRGQVTIPKPIREYLGLTDGGPVEFVVTEDGDVVVRPRFESARPLKGLLSSYARTEPVSLDALDDGIGQEVAEQLARSEADDD